MDAQQRHQGDAQMEAQRHQQDAQNEFMRQMLELMKSQLDKK